MTIANDEIGTENKKKKRLIIISGIVIAVLILLSISVAIMYHKYDVAMDAMEKEDYETAINIFQHLGNFKDSKQYYTQATSEYNARCNQYDVAVDTFKNGDYETSIELFQNLGDFKDAKQYHSQSTDYYDDQCRQYESAITAIEDGNYESAVQTLERLGDFRDSKQYYSQAKYGYADTLIDKGLYSDALACIDTLETENYTEDFDLETLKKKALLGVEVQGEWGKYTETLSGEMTWLLGTYTISGNSAIDSYGIPYTLSIHYDERVEEDGCYILMECSDLEKHPNERPEYLVLRSDGIMVIYLSVDKMIARNRERAYSSSLWEYRRLASTIKKEAPSIGMTKEELEASSWGKPEDINTTITEYGTREQWVYSGFRYVYLEDGIVTAIQK